MELIAENLRVGESNYVLGKEQGGNGERLIKAQIVRDEVWFYSLILGESLDFELVSHPTAAHHALAARLYRLLAGVAENDRWSSARRALAAKWYHLMACIRKPAAVKTELANCN